MSEKNFRLWPTRTCGAQLNKSETPTSPDNAGIAAKLSKVLKRFANVFFSSLLSLVGLGTCELLFK